MIYFLAVLLTVYLVYRSTCVFGNHDWSNRGYGKDYCQKCHIRTIRVRNKK